MNMKILVLTLSLIASQGIGASSLRDCKSSIDAAEKAAGQDTAQMKSAAKRAYQTCDHDAVPAVLRANALVRWSYAAPSGEASAVTQALEKVQREMETKSGMESPDLLPVIDRLAGIYAEQWKGGSALRLLDRALAIRLKAFGSASTETAFSLYALGLFYQNENEPVKAERFYREAVNSANDACAPKCEILSSSYSALAELLKNQPGRQSEAEQYEKEAMDSLPPLN
jgi:hypothetical protein